jgi:hypothetical protein
MFSYHLSFARRMTKENALLKVLIHLTTDGSELLNIHEFLSIQMLQVMVMMISMTNGTLSILLTLLIALVGLNHDGIKMTIWGPTFF